MCRSRSGIISSFGTKIAARFRACPSWGYRCWFPVPFQNSVTYCSCESTHPGPENETDCKEGHSGIINAILSDIWPKYTWQNGSKQRYTTRMYVCMYVCMYCKHSQLRWCGCESSCGCESACGSVRVHVCVGACGCPNARACKGESGFEVHSIYKITQRNASRHSI